MSASSPGPGTVPVSQLPKVVQFPLIALFHLIVVIIKAPSQTLRAAFARHSGRGAEATVDGLGGRRPSYAKRRVQLVRRRQCHAEAAPPQAIDCAEVVVDHARSLRQLKAAAGVSNGEGRSDMRRGIFFVSMRAACFSRRLRNATAQVML